MNDEEARDRYKAVKAKMEEEGMDASIQKANDNFDLMIEETKQFKNLDENLKRLNHIIKLAQAHFKDADSTEKPIILERLEIFNDLKETIEGSIRIRDSIIKN